MSSIPREALNTNASKPGVIRVESSTLNALARAITSCGSEMSAGVILFITSAAVYPSIRSAPTLKIWMTPLASVAILEKLAPVFRPIQIREVILEGTPDELDARAAGEQLHLLVDVGDSTQNIYDHQGINVRFNQGPRVELSSF